MSANRLLERRNDNLHRIKPLAFIEHTLDDVKGEIEGLHFHKVDYLLPEKMSSVGQIPFEHLLFPVFCKCNRKTNINSHYVIAKILGEMEKYAGTVLKLTL